MNARSKRVPPYVQAHAEVAGRRIGDPGNGVHFQAAFHAINAHCFCFLPWGLERKS